MLWADSHEITDEIELPSSEKLVSMYLTQIPTLNSNSIVKDEIDEIIEAPSRFKKETHENKTLDLFVSIVNSEMNLTAIQVEIETESVIETHEQRKDKREKEATANAEVKNT